MRRHCGLVRNAEREMLNEAERLVRIREGACRTALHWTAALTWLILVFGLGWNDRFVTRTFLVVMAVLLAVTILRSFDRRCCTNDAGCDGSLPR